MLAQRKITFVKIIKISLFTSKFDTLATHNSPLIKGEQSGMKNFVFKSYHVKTMRIQVTLSDNKKEPLFVSGHNIPYSKKYADFCSLAIRRY